VTNLRPGSLPRIFDREGGAQFDYVFNCGGETRFSQEEKVYELRSYGLSMAVGREAAKRKIKCFVELSTGMVYKSDSTPRKESDKLKPWNNLAKWKLKAEEDLAKIDGLNLVVMRLANVYGPYTKTFLCTALCMARVYQSKGEEMRFLWKEDLRTNTVHIEDMVRALFHAAEWYAKEPTTRRPVPVFNIVDHGNTCKLPVSLLSKPNTDMPHSTKTNSAVHARNLQHRNRLPWHTHICIRSTQPRSRGRRSQRRDVRSLG
jgi:nucleoside-diphosphate-sugar epimerase